MKKPFKISIILTVSILGLVAALFIAGVIGGFFKAYKHNSEMIAARTFFGLTLNHHLPFEQERNFNYNDIFWQALNRDFNMRTIADEFSLCHSPVKLTRRFFGIEYAIALLSPHSKRLLGIAVCKSFHETFEDHLVENFGQAEVLCDKIKKVIEEKHSCKMIPFTQEPSFVKKFIHTPVPSLDLAIKRQEANIKSESGIYVSPKSCCVATPEFIASIFVVGFREIITYPALKRLDMLSCATSETSDRTFHNKDYVVLLIHSPPLDIEKEKSLAEKDDKLREESLKLEEEAARIREHKEALDAL